MGDILLYHGSKAEVIYPEIRITRYKKVTVPITINRHIDGLIDVLHLELSVYISMSKIPILIFFIFRKCPMNG